MTVLSALGHAFFVHFVIALFVASTIAYTVSFIADQYVVKYQARLLARWGLWFAAGMTLIAILFGLYAYSSGGHDDMSHHLLNMHRNIALLASLTIFSLALWSAILFKEDKEEGVGFLLTHILAAAALLYVTWIGSLLVYQYGVGVSHLPNPQTHNHRTYKKLSDDADSFSIIGH